MRKRLSTIATSSGHKFAKRLTSVSPTTILFVQKHFGIDSFRNKCAIASNFWIPSSSRTSRRCFSLLSEKHPAAYKLVRGMRDLLPETQAAFNDVHEALQRVALTYGYEEMSPPILEHAELFQRSLGTTSDIVNKEMFTFEDQDGSNVCLRPEGTAGITRAVIKHYSSEASMPRLFYFGPMFRRERPQRGRYRQFWQGGIECYGRSSPFADVESICCAVDFLRYLGVENHVKLEINSLYDVDAREKHRLKLLEYFQEHREILSETSQLRLDAGHPLRILDSKSPKDHAVCKNAPRLSEFASDKDLSRFQDVKDALHKLDIPFTINHALVRGLDYYTHTVWEFVGDNGLGSQNTVLAGGRYDGLACAFHSRKPIPAIGWACGVDRLILLREHLGLIATSNSPVAAIIEVHASENELNSVKATGISQYALRVAHYLRSYGLATIHEHRVQLKHQMREALRRQVNFLVFVGQEETSNSTVRLKNTQTEVQLLLPLEDVQTYLTNKIQI